MALVERLQFARHYRIENRRLAQKVDGAATSLNETDDSCCGAKILCATGKATTGPPMIGLPIGMGATGSIGLIDGVAGATTICKAPRKGIGKTGLILAKKASTKRGGKGKSICPLPMTPE